MELLDDHRAELTQHSVNQNTQIPDTLVAHFISRHGGGT